MASLNCRRASPVGESNPTWKRNTAISRGTAKHPIEKGGRVLAREAYAWVFSSRARLACGGIWKREGVQCSRHLINVVEPHHCFTVRSTNSHTHFISILLTQRTNVFTRAYLSFIKGKIENLPVKREFLRQRLYRLPRAPPADERE